MAATMDPKAQTKYLDLKKQVNDLAWKGDFDSAAMPIVEHLISSIETISKSYRQLQDKEGRLASDLALAQAQLFPLRKENARLARENYQLHLDNVKQNEEKDSKVTEHTIEIRQLEDKISELKYLNKMKDDQMKRAELDRERLREAFESMSGKSGQGTRRVMMSSSVLRPSEASKTDDEQDGADAAASVDQVVIASLQKQLEQATISLKRAEAENERLSASVAMRENELIRTTKQSSSDGDSVFSDSKVDQLVAADTANRRIIDQLNSHVDFLNEQLAMREAQLVEASDKIILADTLSVQVKQASRLLEQERSNNSELAAKLIAMEKKVFLLSESVDPEGSVSIDELYERVSQRDDSMDNLENAASAGSNSTVNSAVKPVNAGKKQQVPPSVARKTIPSGSSSKKSDRELAIERETEELLSKRRQQKDSIISGVGHLTSHVDRLQSSDATLKERLHRGEEKIATLKEELTEATRQLAVSSRKLGERDELLSQLMAESKEKTQVNERLLAKLGERSGQAAELQGQATSAAGALGESAREAARLSTLVDDLRVEVLSLKREHAAAANSLDDSAVRVAGLERELSSSQSALERVSRDLGDTKSANVKLQMALDDAEASVGAERRRADATLRSLQEREDELVKRGTSLKEAADTIASLQGSLGSAAASEQLKSDLVSMRGKLQALEDDKFAWQRERDLMQRESSAVLSMSQAQLARETEAETIRNQMSIAMSRKEEELAALHKRMRSLQLEYDVSQSQLHSQEMTCLKLQAALDERKSQFKEHSSAAGQLSSDISLLESRLREAEEAALRASERAKEALRKEAAAVERTKLVELELSGAADQLLVYQGDRDRLEAAVDSLKRQIDAVQKRASADREELRHVTAEKNQLEVRGADLRVLVKNLEASSQSVSHKQTRLTAALEEENEALKRMEFENVKLREYCAARDLSVSDLQAALQSLDLERDRLQAQLDSQEELAEDRERVRKQQEQQIFQLRKVVESTEKKLQGMSNELISAQRQCSATEARLHALKEESLEVKRRLAQKSAEVGGSAEDLMLMTKENQALTSELSETTAERDRLRNRISEVVQAMASLEQSRRAVEMERTDLLESYRTVLQEKRRLESDLLALGEVKQRAGQNVEQLHDQVAELRGRVNATSTAEMRWAAERAALNRQIEALNEELVRTQQKVEAVEADNRRLMQDTHGMRQTNGMLNERVQMVLKRAAAAADANKILSSRLLSVERERDAMRALVGVERQKSTEMGQLAEAARVQAATKDLQLQRIKISASVLGSAEATELANDAPAAANHEDSLDRI